MPFHIDIFRVTQYSRALKGGAADVKRCWAKREVMQLKHKEDLSEKRET
jgi:hypothetical protein